ncbi:hypothetical protein WT73_27875 [Burkholderia stagnalis]|nr:hypothetical protein WT73_27875 [Burkholderia stagnalis]
MSVIRKAAVDAGRIARIADANQTRIDTCAADRRNGGFGKYARDPFTLIVMQTFTSVQKALHCRQSQLVAFEPVTECDELCRQASENRDLIHCDRMGKCDGIDLPG